MSSFIFGPPPPTPHIEIAPGCPWQTNDILEFLLLRAPTASTARQFGVSQFAGQCPLGTVATVALVKKGWHDHKQTGDPWCTIELLFRGLNG